MLAGVLYIKEGSRFEQILVRLHVPFKLDAMIMCWFRAKGSMPSTRSDSPTSCPLVNGSRASDTMMLSSLMWLCQSSRPKRPVVSVSDGYHVQESLAALRTKSH